MKRILIATVVLLAAVSARAATNFVEYIQGTGKGSTKGPWIETDFVIHPSTDKIVAVFRFPTLDTNNRCIWCARGDTTTDRSFTTFELSQNSKQYLRCDYSPTGAASEKYLTDAPLSTSEIYTLERDDKHCLLKNKSGTVLQDFTHTVADLAEAGGPMTLFASYTLSDGAISSSSLSNYGDYRLYSFEIYRDGSLIHRLLPCNADGTVMLYDAVQDKMSVTNAGSGTFTSGPVRTDLRVNGAGVVERLVTVTNATGEATLSIDNGVSYHAGVSEWVALDGTLQVLDKAGFTRSVPAVPGTPVILFALPNGKGLSSDPSVQTFLRPDGQVAVVFTNVTETTFLPGGSGLVTETLAVGGGGAGGNTMGGGGGGGGVAFSNEMFSVLATDSIVAKAGAGGAKVSSGQSAGKTGDPSTLSVKGTLRMSVKGGGGGGGWGSKPGQAGGSGGGGCNSGLGGAGTAGLGFAGGTAQAESRSGGGGGAGGPGQGPDTVNKVSGRGGLGFVSSITGTARTYGAGGGGGGSNSGFQLYAGGAAGGDGAGSGGKSTAGEAGTAGTGGGGGGGGWSGSDKCGGAGGSGTVILSVLYPDPGVIVAGEPESWQSEGSPAYGQFPMSDGTSRTFTAPAIMSINDADTERAWCVGYRTDTFDPATSQWTLGSVTNEGTSYTHEQSGTTCTRLAWIWQKSVLLSITNTTGESVLSLDNGDTWFAGANVWADVGTQWRLTLKYEVRRSLEVTGTGAGMDEDGSYTFTADVPRTIVAAPQQGGTRRWNADFTGYEYLVFVTNAAGVAVLKADPSDDPSVTLSLWTAEGADAVFHTASATGRRIAFYDCPANFTAASDCSSGTVRSVSKGETVLLRSFTPTHVWTGATDTSFETAGNWATAEGGSVDAAPGADATVFVPEGPAKQPVAAQPFTVANLYAGSLTNGTGVVATVSMKHKLENVISNDLFVFSGGRLTHEAVSSNLEKLDSEDRKLIVRVFGDALIAGGGALDAACKGFASSKGPGTCPPNYDQTRAAHGGTTWAGYCYGSVTCPTNCGSGGNYGPGGGAIKLTVDGTCTLNGAISANTLYIKGSRCTGSAGSAWLTCGTLCGTGTVSATAGNTDWAGSGSGGRAAVYIRRNSTGFTGTIEANPGYNTGHKNTFGGPGTVYIERETDASGRGTVIVSAANVLKALGATYWDKLGYTELPSFVAANVVITNLARVQGRTDATIDLTGSWLAEGGHVNAFDGVLRLTGTDDAAIRGSNSFARLQCEVPDKRLFFGTNANERTILKDEFRLRGAAEHPLTAEGADGGSWRLSLAETAGVDVQHVAAAGSDASGGTPVVAYDSEEGTPPCVNWTFLATPQPGDAVTWTGALSASWFDPRNWSPARVPVETDAVTIGPGDHDPVLAINAVTLNSLTVASGATFTLDGVDLAVTNALTVRGTLAITQFERVTVQGNADFAGGTFVPAYGTFVLGGGLAQNADFSGVTFAKLLVRKSAGSVTFAHGFGATTFDFSGSGAVPLSFAAGETVAFGEFVCANGTLVSDTPGTPWYLNVSGSQTVTGTTVTDSHATGIAIYADAQSHAVSGCDRWYFGAVARTWVGEGTAGAWDDSANWSPQGVPDTSSRVTITNASVTVSSAAVAQNVIVGEGASLTVALGASLDCEDGFDVKGGGTAVLNGPLTVTNAVTVRGGGTVTHTQQPDRANTVADEKYRLFITAGGALTVEEGGAIDVTGKGYAPGYGPGKATANIDGTGKAGHGGGYDVGSCYGSMLCPTNSGTGYVTRGGGAVRLVTGGTLRVDGTVAADGVENGTGTGTGAGGSVWVQAARLAGYGTLRADGGAARNYYTGCGGRVAVHLSQATDFTGWTGEIHARGGAGKAYPGHKTDGCNGTVYLQTAGQDATTATVILENAGATTVAGGCWGCVAMKAACQCDTVGNLIVTNGTRVSVPAGEVLKVYGDWRFGQAFSSLSGEVRFCGTNDAHLCGSAVFADLTCEAPGKKLYFGTAASDVVTFARGKRITFAGTEEKPVFLLPETPEDLWTFTVMTDCVTKVSYACVSNSNASLGLPVTAEDSVNLGGNRNWGFVAAILPGAPVYWTGDLSSSWAATENWKDAGGNNRAPVETDEIVVPSGCPNWPVLPAGTKVQYAFRVQSGARLTIRDGLVYATNAFASAGLVCLEGAARVICSNAVTLTGGMVQADPKTVFRLEGPANQTVDPGGCTFARFEVEKGGGGVTFADGLTAKTFDVLTTGPVALSFAPNTTVEAEETIVRGRTNGTEATTYPLVLESITSGQRWRLRATGLQYFSGVDVSDSEALGATACADTLSHDGGNNVNWTFGNDRAAWTGAKNSSFADPANWYPPQVPGADSTVLLTARKGETKSVSITAPTTLSNLCVGAGLGTMTLTASAAAPLTIRDTLAVYTNGTVSLNAKDVPNVVSNLVYVDKGGTLTHDAPASSVKTVDAQDKRLYLDVRGCMTVAAGGLVDVSGKGFASRTGPGAYNGGMYWYGCHGGTRSAGLAYGSALEPVSYGSGGNGAAGGGEIRLQVADTLTVDGTIASDGGNCEASPAGGSVNVRCGTLAGGGNLFARGRDCTWYGGGGGGRLSVRVSGSLAGFTGRMDVRGGWCWGHNNWHGGAGTVYLQRQGQSEGAGTLTVESSGFRTCSGWNITKTRYWTELPVQESGSQKPYKRTTLVLDDLSDLRLTDDMIVRDLDIRNKTAKLKLQGHTLTVRTSKHRDGRGWADDYTNLVVEAGGRIIWQSDGTLLIIR